MTRKLLPPYARDARPTEGGTLNIYCGPMAWRLMKQPIAPSLQEMRCEIVYPADKHPSLYNWPVRDCSVHVYGHDADLRRVVQLLLEVLAAGALEAWLHDTRYEPEPTRFTREDYLSEIRRSA